MGFLAAPKLTPGGVGKGMTDAAWNMAIRHGVGHDGRSLAIMPSTAFSTMSDDELSDLLAYLRSVPSRDSVRPPQKLSVLPRLLIGAGQIALPVDRIDHAMRHESVTPARSVEYGRRSAQSGCTCRA